VVVWPSGSPDDYSGEDPSAPRAPSAAFDRGLFTVPVAGRMLQFAFLSPYLNRLTLSRHQLEASSGWELTRLAYREMQRTVRADGGELVVMFIPSKDQVYLPLLSDSFPRAPLQRALDLCLGHPPVPPDPELLMRNRLALNDLMREFCAQEGIPFLDLTDDLETAVRGGQNVYFPDDSHWNAKGQETAALAVTRLLRAEGF
jgi:hypothetical protein